MNFNVMFLLFSLLLIFSALMVILSKHSVFSLLFLVGCFVLSFLFLLFLECEFLSLLFIIIYVGAITVLFLFAVMMLEIKDTNLSKKITKYISLGNFFIIFWLIFWLDNILFFFSNIVSNSFYSNKYQNWYDLNNSLLDVEVYSHILYSNFVLSFLLGGSILLVVLIGVIYLTNNSDISKKMLRQSVFKQLARNSKFLEKS